MKTIITATDRGVKINGNPTDIMTCLAMTMEALLNNKVCTKEDILRCLDLASMSKEELDKELEKVLDEGSKYIKGLKEVKEKILSGEISKEEASEALINLLDKKENK